MIEPTLYDVIETLHSLPGESLPAGSQGTLVHQHEANVFEVEFVNEVGETTALCTLAHHEFMVVWQVATEQPVSTAEQVAQVVALLPQQAGSEVLDFARFLSPRQRLERSESAMAQ